MSPTTSKSRKKKVIFLLVKHRHRSSLFHACGQKNSFSLIFSGTFKQSDISLINNTGQCNKSKNKITEITKIKTIFSLEQEMPRRIVYRDSLLITTFTVGSRDYCKGTKDVAQLQLVS